MAFENIEIIKADSDENIITLNEIIPFVELANRVYERARYE